MNNGKSLLTVSRLFKSFSQNGTETEVLEDLSFRLNEGEIVAIVGPSGCGKSTLLHILSGFDRGHAGEILFRGEEIAGPSYERGMIFQNPQLFSWLSVRDNISFGLKRKKIGKAEISRQTNSLLLQTGMADFADFFPYQLSGGMQQRVALARALVMRPMLLLMDEPFSALDYQSRLGMQELTLSLWNEYRPSLLLVTHDIEEAVLMADRVIVLSERPGRIISEIIIPFARPRRLSLLKDFRFHSLKTEILDLLISGEGRDLQW